MSTESNHYYHRVGNNTLERFLFAKLETFSLTGDVHDVKKLQTTNSCDRYTDSQAVSWLD